VKMVMMLMPSAIFWFSLS